jgi:hypothetical protein
MRAAPSAQPPLKSRAFSAATFRHDARISSMDFLSKACGERVLGKAEAGGGYFSSAQLWWLYGRGSDCVQRYLLHRHSSSVARTAEAHATDDSAPIDLWHLEELLLDPSKRAERLRFEGEIGQKTQLVPGVVVDDEGFMPLHLATVLCSHFSEHCSVLQARCSLSFTRSHVTRFFRPCLRGVRTSTRKQSAHPAPFSSKQHRYVTTQPSRHFIY